MRRRRFLKLLLSAGGSTVLCGCSLVPGSKKGRRGRRVVVLAFDGMDPRLTAQLMAAGRMESFSRLAARGSFGPIATSTPPVTPVAFANIIGGNDPATHGIFDFIHRDSNPVDSPLAVEASFSLSQAIAPENDWAVPLGKWRLPLSGGDVRLMRRGPSFWDYLVSRGEDVDLYHLPGTYPPGDADGPGRFRCLAGMGTPDLLGTYGEFTVFTDDPAIRERRVGGGRFARITLTGHHTVAKLEGPPNFLLAPDEAGLGEPMSLDLSIVRDPESSVAMIHAGGEKILLNKGEWSRWIPVRFQTGIPGGETLSALRAPTAVTGMVRFYLKQVHPYLNLYVSPVNFDPQRPANPISAPGSFARELAQRDGRFYTTGIPEDTKALSRGALNEDEFLAQCDLVLEEKIAEYRTALDEFGAGCLFSYFGTTDLVQHMFWRDRDPEHPGRKPEQDGMYDTVIDDLYARMDGLVGEAMAKLSDDDTLIVLSDHGFTTFRRELSVNTWLLENGYLGLLDPSRQGRSEMFINTDWSRTRAYAMGLNALYVNEQGREKHGVVAPSRKRALAEEIAVKLQALRDDDGSKVVEKVYRVADIYPGADRTVAPDLIIGYAEGYRSSWATSLGGVPRYVLRDNRDRWSGTHCVATHLLPGMLLTNRSMGAQDADLRDIAPTILGAFGVKSPNEMQGRDLFAAG